ncbi:hypothetical protein B0H63DRAFT_446163 [Podospora didyma]|uniref:Uncharacterized protein n=1 Tax=Podospora didyma TaxID=330526 RepID=A0AAE0U400_9PEZI|nr:hypothetical protein B0H63DRAFT_446163 [Podospora didyma]
MPLILTALNGTLSNNTLTDYINVCHDILSLLTNLFYVRLFINVVRHLLSDERVRKLPMLYDLYQRVWHIVLFLEVLFLNMGFLWTTSNFVWHFFVIQTVIFGSKKLLELFNDDGDNKGDLKK